MFVAREEFTEENSRQRLQTQLSFLKIGSLQKQQRIKLLMKHGMGTNHR